MKYLSIALGVLGLLVVVLMLVMLRKPSDVIVTFDMKRVRGQFIHQLARHHATDAMVTASSAHLSQTLQGVLDAYAASHQVVILEQTTRLAGGEDATDALIPLIARAMRGQA